MSNGGSKRSSSSFHFVAGLGSGVFTAVLLQPADLLKTRVQQSPSTSLFLTLRTIATGPSPIRQLWRGTAPSAIRTGCGSALYFGSLNLLRQTIAHRNALRHASSSTASSSSLPKLSNLENLATGAIARAGAGFIMMPLTVIKVRYESSLYSYTSLFGAGRDILLQDGLKGFFAGFGATAVRDAPYAGLYVLFYEQSKKRLSKLAAAVASAPAKAEILYTTPEGGAAITAKAAPPIPPPPPPTIQISSGVAASINFVSGMLAAVTSTALTNPFDAIKTRLQLMPRKYGNMVRAAKIMLREEGVRSLFQGLGIRIGRKAIASALAWTVYEEMVRRAEVRWAAQAAAL